MCYRPISIANNTIDFHSGVHPVYRTFPCGKCEDCQKQRSDDMFVRMFYEWKRIKDVEKRGKIYFLTFTYHDDFKPTFNPSSLSSVLSSYATDNIQLPDCTLDSFDNAAVRKAIKKLRIYLDRYYDTKCKVFLVCEYGSDPECSHRPHYHVILFIDSNLNEFIIKELAEMAWSSSIKSEDVPEYWRNNAIMFFKNHPYNNYYIPYGKGDVGFYCAHRSLSSKTLRINFQRKNGYVSYSKDGAEVQSIECLSYLTKYLAKDVNYMSLPHVKEVVTFLDNLPPIGDITDKDELAAISQLKSIFPFNIIPQGFGSLLFHELDEVLYGSDEHKREQAIKQLVDNTCNIPGKHYVYKIPTYIINKLFYNIKDVSRTELFTDCTGREIIEVINTKKRFYTEIACEVLTERSKRARKSLENTLCMLLHPNFLASFRNLSVLSPLFPGNDGQDLRKHFDFMVSALPKEIDFSLLATYKLHFQNMSLDLYRGYDFPHMTSNDWMAVADSFIAYRIDFNEVVTSNFAPPCKDVLQRNFFLKCGLFNELDNFKDFDFILSVVDFMKHKLSEAKADKQSSDFIIIRQIRDYYNRVYNHI